MKRSSLNLTDVASWYCALVLLALILLASIKENNSSSLPSDSNHYDNSMVVITTRGNRFFQRPCDEIYVVGEGETLNTISDKCGDPFIVERNPHIHDPDDVFPGLVIKIMPTKPKEIGKASLKVKMHVPCLAR
ncbi:hypothetical protein ACFE04_028914 [Oxalis oulophora]